MATTNVYISLNPGQIRVGKVTEASSSTAGDVIELRMMTTHNTTATNLSKLTVIQALKVFQQYLQMGGFIEFNNAGSPKLPLPAPGAQTY